MSTKALETKKKVQRESWNREKRRGGHHNIVRESILGSKIWSPKWSAPDVIFFGSRRVPKTAPTSQHGFIGMLWLPAPPLFARRWLLQRASHFGEAALSCGICAQTSHACPACWGTPLCGSGSSFGDGAAADWLASLVHPAEVAASSEGRLLLPLYTLLAAGSSLAFWHRDLALRGALPVLRFPAPSSEGRRFTHLVQLGSRFAFALLCLTVTGAR